MTHTLALARTACVLIPAVDQVTFATAKKDTRAIRMFLMDAKILMSVLTNNLHALAARTHLEVSLVQTRDP